MLRHGWIGRFGWLALLLITAPAVGQYPSGGGAPPAGGPAVGPAVAGNRVVPAAQPPYRVAERSEIVTQQPAAPQLRAGDPNEHPLMPALRWAREGLGSMEKIGDYSATVVKRERIGNKLGDYEYMFVKIRHKPFSVYMYFLAPASLKGQEVIYVNGANDGKMWAHGVGMQQTMFGTVSLKPDGIVAMRGQRYPITELGVITLVRRLIEVAEQDIKYGECEVKYLPNAKINGRSTTCVQVVHPVPRKNFLFHIARIFVDDEMNVPLRYESYDWPKEPGAAPELIEEYTYLNVKLNNGFTDADFDIHNTNYHFR
jgi:hypothetical protein